MMILPGTTINDPFFKYVDAPDNELIQLCLSNEEGCVVTSATLLIHHRFRTFTTYIDLSFSMLVLRI